MTISALYIIYVVYDVCYISYTKYSLKLFHKANGSLGLQWCKMVPKKVLNLTPLYFTAASVNDNSKCISDSNKLSFKQAF